MTLLISISIFPWKKNFSSIIFIGEKYRYIRINSFKLFWIWIDDGHGIVFKCLGIRTPIFDIKVYILNFKIIMIYFYS